MNDPDNFHSAIHEIGKNVEPMEVDNEPISNETLSTIKDEAGVDEVDNQLTNTADPPIESLQEYLKEEGEEFQPLSEERAQVEQLNNTEEANLEQGICAEAPEEENENHVSSENHENSEPVEENKPSEAKENLQDSFGDFTEEVQQSSIETPQKDLNKEILDDWDDTDSQQSQSQEHETQNAALNGKVSTSWLYCYCFFFCFSKAFACFVWVIRYIALLKLTDFNYNLFLFIVL